MNRYAAVPLRRIAHLAYGDSLSAEVRREGDIPVFGSNGPVGVHDTSNTFAPVIVIGRKGSFGKIHFSHVPVFAIDTTYFVDSRYTATDLRWLFYALSTMGLDGLSQDVGVPGLARETAYPLPMPLPPHRRQVEIANHLDAETARIDRVVEKVALMQDRLNERLRARVKSDLSTGDWVKVPLRRAASRIRTGGTPPDSNQGEIGWFTPASFRERLRIGPPVRSIPRGWVEDGTATLFRADSTLLVGIGATAGRVAHLDVEGSGNQQLTAIESSAGVVPRFLSWQMWARADELRGVAPATTLPIISNELLRSFPFFLPPEDAQRELAQVWDRTASAVGAMTTTTDRLRDLLVERRQALVTAAVAGQLEIPRVAV